MDQRIYGAQHPGMHQWTDTFDGLLVYGAHCNGCGWGITTYSQAQRDNLAGLHESTTCTEEVTA